MAPVLVPHLQPRASVCSRLFIYESGPTSETETISGFRRPIYLRKQQRGLGNASLLTAFEG